MAASRKLQQEIERTIKRINEGCDEFDQIWDKVYDPDQAALKEKNEADLKKELKKLQKCRDQIKNWISGNEVKDKTDLLAARRAVERQMERFKVCERESKTKTFSKEGLSLQATKVDPAQARRNDARDWITATVSTLEEECEAFEAEVESLGGGSGGGGGGGDAKGGGGRRGKARAIPPRVTHLEASAERHRAHVARLEQLLRLLDNEAVDVGDVEGVRELVDDYLARNQGGSEEAADRATATMTPDEFAEPDDLYEGLLERLDAVEAALPLVPSAVALKAHKGGGDDKGGNASSSLATAGSSGSAVGGSVGGGASSAAASASKAAAVAAAAKQQLAASGVLRGVKGGDDDDDASSSSTSMGAKTTTVVRRPSTSGAELPSSPAVSRKGGLDAPSPLAAGPASAASAAAAAAPPPRTAAPWAGIAAATAAAAAAASARKGGGGAEDGGGAGGGGPGSASGTPRASSAGGGGVKAAAVGAAANGTATSGAAPLAATTAATSAAAVAINSKPPPLTSPASAAAPQQLQQKSQQLPLAPSTLSPIVPSAPPAVLQSLLAACAPRSIPTPADSAWSRIPPRRRALHGDGGGKAGAAAASADGSASSPASPSASGDGGTSSGTSGPVVVPASYPTTRLPVLDNPALFERLDTEALFFAFYHQPGTYQQYLAARELKRQSWRYHKAHGAWFQRHEEPRAAGAEFERGTFVYFDYNLVHDDASAGWCYRLKQDFTFTYDQLEDELQP